MDTYFLVESNEKQTNLILRHYCNIKDNNYKKYNVMKKGTTSISSYNYDH